MDKYEGIIYWSNADKAFIAIVPELPGCLAYGGSCVDAVKNVEVVMKEWLETAKELGRWIPEAKGRLMYPERGHIPTLSEGDGPLRGGPNAQGHLSLRLRP